jgi:hypothetical protein
MLTLWIVLVSVLQILYDAVLTDDLFNLALSVNVKGVLVEQGNLVLTLAFRILLLTLFFIVCLCPAGWVTKGRKHFRLALSQLLLCCRVA